MLSTIKHPEKYVWDFWYYFDDERVFHIFYLNADPFLVPNGQHHFNAEVGYATTIDFTEINWIADDVLCANPTGWDNTSIWTGDVVRIGNGFLLFYTSRDAHVDDGFTQNIGCAFVQNIRNWQSWKRIPSIRIKPESPYQIHGIVGDDTIHAWRDPFIFVHNRDIYIILSAKCTDHPIGRQGAIALLKATSADFTQWEIMDPLASPGWYAEMEVPQLYFDSYGEYRLVFSTWAKNDFSAKKEKQGGLHSIRLSSSLDAARPETGRDVLLPEASGLYAARIVPELEGEIVGFDVAEGGIRRSGIKTNLSPVNRDLSGYRLREVQLLDR